MFMHSEASAGSSRREENSVIRLSENISIGKQPSVDQLKELRGRGFASIINLRCPGEPDAPMEPVEEGRAAIDAGLAYGHVPVPIDTLPGESLALFRKELGRLCEPVFVHCAAGDRAEALALAHLVIETGGCLENALEITLGTSVEDESLREMVRACIKAHEAGELERLRNFRWICR